MTLNVSVRGKYGGILKCAHLSTYIQRDGCEAGLRGILTRQIEGSHREREQISEGGVWFDGDEHKEGKQRQKKKKNDS